MAARLKDKLQKEPWEMTQAEYTAFREEGIDWTITTSGPGEWGKTKWRQRTIELHRDSIERAISEGKPVPPEVLKDYPDLQAKSLSVTPFLFVDAPRNLKRRLPKRAKSGHRRPGTTIKSIRGL